MQLLLEEGLPFISLLVASSGGVTTVDRVLVDSGSASTILAYGFPIDGILGMDLLTQTGAIIDLHRLTLEFANP
jgi:hypothetical protein